MPKGVRENPIAPGDLKRATKWGRALVRMVERQPEKAAELGILEEDVELARELCAGNDRLVAKVPTAKAMFLTALSGGVTREEVLTRHHNTILAIHNLAAMAGYVAAAKLDDHQAPGSTRVALEILKGTGVLVPAEPMAARKRDELLSEDVLATRDTEDLKAEVLKFS